MPSMPAEVHAIVAVAAIAVGVGAPIVAATLDRVWIALGQLVPVLLGLGALAAQAPLLPEDGAPWTTAVLRLASAAVLVALAVVGGSPLVRIVLDRLGGGAPEGDLPRGGRWIGFAERALVVGGAAFGHPEAIAFAIAVKGLGRFSELTNPPAGFRERFIVGTLVSYVWAAACGFLVARL